MHYLYIIFKSSAIVTNYFTTFLQTGNVVNFLLFPI